VGDASERHGPPILGVLGYQIEGATMSQVTLELRDIQGDVFEGLPKNYQYWIFF